MVCIELEERRSINMGVLCLEKRDMPASSFSGKLRGENAGRD